MAASPRNHNCSSSSTPASLSSSVLYPSSCSSANSVPPLTTDFSSPSSSPHQRSSHTRDHLDSLIARHGCPTRFSLSSLDELTATYSTYNPPSPLPRSRSPAADLSDSFDKLSTYQARSRPIPIPRSAFPTYEEDVPVTPLTGRFERDCFPHRDLSARNPSPERDFGKRSRYYRDYRSSRMRSDSSSFYSPAVSQSMSSSGRSNSPQPGMSRAQKTGKSAPAFQLGDLPRFHPAVYQSSGGSQAVVGPPPSPRQTRQHSYRSSASRDPISQYRDFVEGVVLQKPVSRPLSPGPSAPRLNPLNSPGPVTPLALEEAGGYIAAGSSSRPDPSSRDFQHSAPAPDVLERLIARENERVRQKARKPTKGW